MYINNAPTTVGEVLEEMRKKKPDAKVCYHKIQVPEGTSMTEFKLECTHRVAFVSTKASGEEDAKDKTIHTFGLRADKESWEESPTVAVRWHVRWSAKGLTPSCEACCAFERRTNASCWKGCLLAQGVSAPFPSVGP